MKRLYPELIQYHKITVYDVADKVLSMFDEKLSKYAIAQFKRDNIDVLTSHHVEELRPGVPASMQNDPGVKDTPCYTVKIKEQGEIGVGMCVWSTGLMMNPFVEKSLPTPTRLPSDNLEDGQEMQGAGDHPWKVKTNPKSGAIMTNDRLRVVMEPKEAGQEGRESESQGRAVLKNVYALGDCAMMENSMYPATAQVANQKARWLVKRLNKGDLDTQHFTYKDLGVMAYIGNWNAIMQSSGAGDISGRVAWLIWRGAYLAKSVSWRNRILIATYW